MALFKRKKYSDEEIEYFTETGPQLERVFKRYKSGNPRLLPKYAERTLRAEFTRVVGMKAAEHADWVVLWHEPAFKFVKEIELRRTVGSTHEIKRGEILYVIPESEESYDPFSLHAVDGNGDEAGYLSMRDEKARLESWDALVNGKIVIAVAKQNRKPKAALFVYQG